MVSLTMCFPKFAKWGATMKMLLLSPLLGGAGWLVEHDRRLPPSGHSVSPLKRNPPPKAPSRAMATKILQSVMHYGHGSPCEGRAHA
jgi:hypothetical protein